MRPFCSLSDISVGDFDIGLTCLKCTLTQLNDFDQSLRKEIRSPGFCVHRWLSGMQSQTLLYLAKAVGVCRSMIERILLEIARHSVSQFQSNAHNCPSLHAVNLWVISPVEGKRIDLSTAHTCLVSVSERILEFVWHLKKRFDKVCEGNCSLGVELEWKCSFLFMTRFWLALTHLKGCCYRLRIFFPLPELRNKAMATCVACAMPDHFSIIATLLRKPHVSMIISYRVCHLNGTFLEVSQLKPSSWTRPYWLLLLLAIYSPANVHRADFIH